MFWTVLWIRNDFFRIRVFRLFRFRSRSKSCFGSAWNVWISLQIESIERQSRIVFLKLRRGKRLLKALEEFFITSRFKGEFFGKMGIFFQRWHCEFCLLVIHFGSWAAQIRNDFFWIWIRPDLDPQYWFLIQNDLFWIQTRKRPLKIFQIMENDSLKMLEHGRHKYFPRK